MTKRVQKLVFWAPRILSILFILFLALMSLDVFSPGLSFQQIVVGLFIHNIPVFILLAILLISWKYEIVGGIAFILAGILYVALMIRNMFQYQFGAYMLSYSLIIAGPAFLIGILFIINWINKNKQKSGIGGENYGKKSK